MPAYKFRSHCLPAFLLLFVAARGSAQSITCAAGVSVPPTLRTESATESIGDIVITCTGGQTGQYSLGSPLPLATLTVSLANANSTSRLLVASINPNVSEALLLIDEPGSGLPTLVPGTGSQAPQTLCTSSLGAGAGGCPQYPWMVSGVNTPVMSGSPTSLVNPSNVYQGVWNTSQPNQIQFVAVPILAPVFGVTRTYRITNIRANTSAIAAGSPVNVSVSVNAAAGLLSLTGGVQQAGSVTPSLGVAARNLGNTGPLSPPALSGCNGESGVTPTAVIEFSENFGTAWKTRVVSGPTYNAQGEFLNGFTYAQNIPGTIYNSESGFVLNTQINGTTAGLTDYGTRLKATFHGIPAGVRVFVSVNNVANASEGASGGATAALVSSETASDTNLVATFPAVAATTTVNGIPAAELAVDGTGTAVAVWEVISANPASLDTASFAVYQLYGSVTSNATVTVNLSYGPTPPDSSGSTLAAWEAASSTLHQPRFLDLSVPQTLFGVTACALPSTLAIRKSHSGNFSPGQQGAAYTVTVSNAASASTTSGTVTVTENLPAGLTLASMSGPSWNCFGIACSRNDALAPGFSYPTITVTVNVAANPPAQVINQVTVSGGGSASSMASDATNIGGGNSCSFGLSPSAAILPSIGTSTLETCPNGSGQPNCGVSPEIPVSFGVTPGGSCGSWTVVSSNPAVLQITSGASGNGPGTVAFTLLNNTHTTQQTYTITVSSGSSSAVYAVTEAGSGNSQTYREVYALYEQLLGRDPDPAGFAFWTGSGGAGLGQMADSFLTSPEAFNADFAVMAAYQAATGGAPTFAEFTSAVASIRYGSQSLAGLFNSLINGSYTQNNLYQNLLNRQPVGADNGCISAGLANCFEILIGYPAGGTPIGAFNNEFQSTGIYHTSLAADHTNALYVQMLYYVILGRVPDPGGLGFWFGIANSGGPGLLFQGNAGYATRIQIMGPGTAGQGFIGSNEFQGLFAN